MPFFRTVHTLNKLGSCWNFINGWAKDYTLRISKEKNSKKYVESSIESPTANHILARVVRFSIAGHIYSKNSAWKYWFCFAEFFKVNSVCLHIPFPIHMMTFADYFQSFGKGCRIIRRAEFLEEIRYVASVKIETYMLPLMGFKTHWW